MVPKLIFGKGNATSDEGIMEGSTYSVLSIPMHPLILHAIGRATRQTMRSGGGAGMIGVVAWRFEERGMQISTCTPV